MLNQAEWAQIEIFGQNYKIREKYPLGQISEAKINGTEVVHAV